MPKQYSNRDRKMNVKFKQNFAEFQKEIGIQFTNEALLFQAFTHSSYVNEHRRRPYEDNERLEFLGDAVLELTVSQFLFKKYPTMSEGELTKLRAQLCVNRRLLLLQMKWILVN